MSNKKLKVFIVAVFLFGMSWFNVDAFENELIQINSDILDKVFFDYKSDLIKLGDTTEVEDQDIVIELLVIGENKEIVEDIEENVENNIDNNDNNDVSNSDESEIIGVKVFDNVEIEDKAKVDSFDLSDIEKEFIEELPIGSICGNGIIEEGEICDDGNILNEDGCDAACNIEDEDFVKPPIDLFDGGLCGNGIIEEEEICDDGNTLNEDGCRADCKYEYYIDTNIEIY
ncbi:DUF4215 domain-containing protein [bacterium]|nr:DUF4215 domain-containing protein [bacterium]